MRLGKIRWSAVRDGFRMWSLKHTLVALLTSVVVGLGIAYATALIPNPIFMRDIPPTAWDVPVLVVVAVLTGILIATYVRPQSQQELNRESASSDHHAASIKQAGSQGHQDQPDQRGSTMGMIGTVLTWFAVGCPVCNKIALLALGYTGAMTYFAPWQPVLAVIAILFSGYAVLFRLQGQVFCPMPGSRRSNAARDEAPQTTESSSEAQTSGSMLR